MLPAPTPTLVANPELTRAARSHADEAHGHAGTQECLNCGQAVTHRFCGRCGQDAHHTHRLTMKDMPHDVLHSIWHVDKGILYTLKTMVLRPGPTIRAYLAGQRVDHFRPLSLLFVITGLYALLHAVLKIDMAGFRDPNVSEAVWQMQKTSMGFMMKYLSWCYVAMVPVWALFARWFLRRGGYNYAECLIIAAFVTSICNFFALLYLPVMYRFSGTPQLGTASMWFMLPVVGYSTWAYGSLLTHTTLGLARRLWCGFMTYLLGYVVSIMLFVTVMYALNWSTFMASMQQQMQLEKQKQEMQKQTRNAQPVPAPQPR